MSKFNKLNAEIGGKCKLELSSGNWGEPQVLYKIIENNQFERIELNETIHLHSCMNWVFAWCFTKQMLCCLFMSKYNWRMFLILCMKLNCFFLLTKFMTLFWFQICMLKWIFKVAGRSNRSIKAVIKLRWNTCDYICLQFCTWQHIWEKTAMVPVFNFIEMTK